MRLHRIMTISLDKKLPESFGASAQFGDTELNLQMTSQESKTQTVLLTIASMPCEFQITLDEEQRLLVPFDFRKSLEAKIEAMANMLSISFSARRGISSIDPFIAISEMSGDQAKILNQCHGISGQPTISTSADHSFDFTDTRIISLMLDRLDGLSLLAESYSTEHALSRYREYVRLFELAFARPLGRILIKG